MLQNFFKISFRNIFRNKVYATINILGLAMGIAAFLLLMQYIGFEKSVNQFHKDIANKYRILNEAKDGATWGEVEPGWAKQAVQRFPEIKEFCRFEDGVAAGIVALKGNKDRSYREAKIGYAE